MKHFICVDINGATPFGIGHQCPTPDCQGHVSMMDLLKWTFKCTRGCGYAMPSYIALIHVDVEYLRQPKDRDANAGQPS